MTKYQVRGGLEMIWTALHTRVQQRQQRYSKAIAKFENKRINKFLNYQAKRYNIFLETLRRQTIFY